MLKILLGSQSLLSQFCFTEKTDWLLSGFSSETGETVGMRGFNVGIRGYLCKAT